MAGKFAFKEILRQAGGISRYARRRFVQDQCLRAAASLSYTSLLALVPLTAVGFAMLSAFPVFGNMEEQIQDFIFENFLPESIGTVQEYFNSFIDNAGSMTVFGIAGLAITAMMLLATIETSINTIFRISQKRRISSRILVFWAILTLGPMLLGASFSLSSHILSLTKEVGVEAFTGPLGRLTRMVPALIAMAAFAFFYFLVPNRRVRWHHAAMGGVVAGALFSGLRWLFGIYIIYVPTYQTIYGALAALPIFLVWIYLSWTTVLIGAVITASLPVWHRPEGHGRLTDMDGGERLALGLGIVAALVESSRTGRTLRRADILDATGAVESAADLVLERLRSHGYVDSTGANTWVLTRDPDSATLFGLYQALGLETRVPDDIGEGDLKPWQQRLRRIAAESGDAQRDYMSVSLREFFRP